MPKKTQDQLREEHRELGKHLNKLHEERKNYEVRGGDDVTDQIDKEMDDIRDKQKKLYKEFQDNRKG